MYKQAPLPTNLEPHSPTGLIKLTLDLYLSVSWFLIFNLFWNWKVKYWVELKMGSFWLEMEANKNLMDVLEKSKKEIR